MKKIFLHVLPFVAATVLSLGFSSCNNDDEKEDNNGSGTVMKAIVTNYVDNIIYPTYDNLAKGTKDLQAACQSLYAKRKAGTLTQEDIDVACEAFKTARKHWEQSEAFLYGAASDNEIDPHIDSWPLDHAQLVEALNNDKVIAGIKSAQPDKFVYDNNGKFDSVLGFHGLEFVLFRNGAHRTLADMTNEYETEEGLTSVKTLDECAFAAAVSGDLRNMTSLLAYGWMGENASNDVRETLKNAPWVIGSTRNAGLSSKGVGYGEAVKGATTAIGMFSTWQETLQNIFVGGCSSICQEVYTQKLGQAYRVSTGQGSSEDASDYVESPYSKRSFQDYQDNLYSIKHSLYGTLDDNATAPTDNSLMTFLKNNNYEGYSNLVFVLNEAIASLETAKKSGKAFIDAPGDIQVKNCIDKIKALDEALNEAGSWIQRQPVK